MTPRGMFRHEMAVQNYTTTVDSYGQGTKTWTTAATVLGYIENADGRSVDAVDVTQGQTAYRIVIPWIDSVTIKSRILLRETGKTDRTLELTGVVDPDLRRMELHLEALEVTA
jgi:SPP1 family predicted phage head-tail adaptor